MVAGMMPRLCRASELAAARRDDRGRERDLDREDRALAAPALDLQAAADRLEVPAHHVHADAAARDARRFGGRGEAGPQDEVLDLLLGHAGELGLGREAHRERLAPDLRDVEPAPVVADPHREITARAEGLERDDAGLGLALGDTLRGRLDA